MMEKVYARILLVLVLDRGRILWRKSKVDKPIMMRPTRSEANGMEWNI